MDALEELIKRYDKSYEVALENADTASRYGLDICAEKTKARALSYKQEADFLRELKAYKGAEQEIRGLTQTWEEGVGIKQCIGIIDKWHEEVSNADIR